MTYGRVKYTLFRPWSVATACAGALASRRKITGSGDANAPPAIMQRL